MAKKYNPNESQSTREPSQRSVEPSSLEGVGSSMINGSGPSKSSTMVLANSNQIGGGSYRSYVVEHLVRLHADIEATTRKLELEQRRLYSIDEDLRNAESEHKMKREKHLKKKKASEDGEKKEEDKKAPKKEQPPLKTPHDVKMLESRLEKAIAELNQGKHENDKLREQINQLRKERMIHDTVFQKLAKAIKNTERMILKVKQTTVDAARDDKDAKRQMEAIDKTMERERFEFKGKCLSLKEAMYQQDTLQKEQAKLQESLRLSAQQSQRDKTKKSDEDSPKAEKGEKDPKQPQKFFMVADEEEAFSSDGMFRRILKLSFLNAIQRRHIRQHKKNIEVFEQAFATIKSSTGISDIEEIVKIFVRLEERHYSLLTYVNNLNREIEAIEKRNSDLQNQLKDHKEQNKTSEEKKQAALSEIQTQIKKTIEAADEKENMVQEAADALGECRPILWGIVKYLQEELPPLVQSAYEGDPPPMKFANPDEHDENLNNFLMFIEEAVLQFRICLPQDSQVHPRIPQRKESRVNRPNELPSAKPEGDDSDDEESGLGDKPWTRNELRERVQHSLQRRRRAGRHGRPHEHESTPDEPKDTEVGDGERKECWWRGKGQEKKKSPREPSQA